MKPAVRQSLADGPDGLHPQYFRLAGEPLREYFAYCPPVCGIAAQPLVVVHGISRNAVEIVLRFTPLARRFGVPLIAPLFPRESYGMYQQVIDRRSGVRSDLALFDMVSDAAARWGFSADRFALFGFSGGAQFAHRLTMLHPERIGTCIPASAGWYTMPDPASAWPLGLADAPLGPLDREALAEVPIHTLVGRRDTGCGDALRRNPALDAAQGETRLQRARTWHRAMRKSGMHPDSTLTVLPRTRHSFASAERRGLPETVFALLGHTED
jgi:pimeloyl-ACP methyl ester carboxylesterase